MTVEPSSPVAARIYAESALDVTDSDQTIGVVVRQISIAIVVALVGCATTRPPDAARLGENELVFQKVVTLDLRPGANTDEDFQMIAQPGDLIVASMRLGRAVKKREWLFTVLPHGHAMIVVDPADPLGGIFEGRFHGARMVGTDELRLYSYFTIYRLSDPAALDIKRLREFARHAVDRCDKYSFKSWIGLNDELAPTAPAQISDQYTCSTIAVAAYHYAGVSLDLVDQEHRVITPLSLVASPGRAEAPSHSASSPIQQVSASTASHSE